MGIQFQAAVSFPSGAVASTGVVAADMHAASSLAASRLGVKEADVTIRELPAPDARTAPPAGSGSYGIRLIAVSGSVVTERFYDSMTEWQKAKDTFLLQGWSVQLLLHS